MVTREVFKLGVAEAVDPASAEIFVLWPQPVERAEGRVAMVDRAAAGELEDLVFQPTPAVVFGKRAQRRDHNRKGRRADSSGAE